MLVSKSAIAAGVLVSCCPTSLTQSFVSADLATRFFNLRKGSGMTTILERVYIYPYQPPSETQPLAIAMVGYH